MKNLYDFDDFDIDLYADGKGESGGAEPASITTGISTLTSFTSATNSSTSISCAIATNLTEYKCKTCNSDTWTH